MNAFIGEGSKIRWGAVIAGAAIAVGVVMVAPVIADKLPTVIGELLDKIGEIGTSLLGSHTVSDATAEALKRLTGAGLIGGGVAYFTGGRKEPYHDPALHASRDESFALQEDMRKMQGLMVARAAAAGNPQAQAMLSQQMGRG